MAQHCSKREREVGNLRHPWRTTAHYQPDEGDSQAGTGERHVCFALCYAVVLQGESIVFWRDPAIANLRRK
jgi:hypothetical protein